MDAPDPSAPPAPKCTRCRHYWITHDPGFPYGCRLHGFKSRRAPHLEVLQASGTRCLGFEARSPRRPANGAA